MLTRCKKTRNNGVTVKVRIGKNMTQFVIPLLGRRYCLSRSRCFSAVFMRYRPTDHVEWAWHRQIILLSQSFLLWMHSLQRHCWRAMCRQKIAPHKSRLRIFSSVEKITTLTGAKKQRSVQKRLINATKRSPQRDYRDQRRCDENNLVAM